LDPGWCDACSYLWSNGSNERIINIVKPGNYTVTISNAGCQIKSSIDVKDCVELWLPNVFTPNGDGLNDSFHPKFKNIDHFEMLVFNRWGELICSTTDIYLGLGRKIQGSGLP